MPSFNLNKLDKTITKNDITKELKKFGQVKYVGNINVDKQNPDFHFTTVDYKELSDEKGFFDFCKSKRIFAKEKKSNAGQSNPQQKHVDHKIQQQSRFSSTIPNPSFYFYKDKKYGEDIEHFRLTDNYEELFSVSQAQTFELTTIYPGLLVGSGYSHPKRPEKNNDFQLGFFFDHTTGLPIISGSSIKGLLRSVIEKKDFVKEVYDKDVDTAVFEDQTSIFYDAFIVSSKNEENKIFGTDFITNHYSNEKDGMFKEPNPIKFLKILPNVTFRFQFKVDDKYLELFKEIIVDFGLGAKTNTGYGKFIEQ